MSENPVKKHLEIGIANGKLNHLNLWKRDNPDCNHYYSNETTRCDFCNPMDTSFKSKYSKEEVEQMLNDKRTLLDKWKDQFRMIH